MDHSFYETLGLKLRTYRKAKQLTLSDLAKVLNRSLATVGKYEKGEISIDLEVLIDWCRYLEIDIATLLPGTIEKEGSHAARYENYFMDRLYLYWYKGGERKIHCHVIENDNVSMKSMFYFDVNDQNNFYDADFVYKGHVTYTDASTYFVYYNTAPPFDLLTFCMPFLTKDQYYKIGLISTITFFYQPNAIKTLASKVPITDKDYLISKLQLTPEEIKNMKQTNFFIV